MVNTRSSRCVWQDAVLEKLKMTLNNLILTRLILPPGHCMSYEHLDRDAFLEKPSVCDDGGLGHGFVVEIRHEKAGVKFKVTELVELRKDSTRVVEF